MQLPLRRRIADRVWQWRRATYATGTVVMIAALAFVFISISTPTSSIEVSTEPTFFDANRSLRVTQELARLYPNRQLGSEDATGAVAWLSEKLGALGIEFFQEKVFVPFGDKRMPVENVWVVIPGASDETILFSAPRDPAMDPESSSLAQAAPTAVLLDLIQVFAGHQHNKTLVFLSSEGGSQGGLGLSAFLNSYPERDRIAVAVSVEALGAEGRTSLEAGTTGPGTATPGWLVDTATRVLARANLHLRVPNLQQQVADQALRLFSGEQVAALRAGIPAITLMDRGEGTVTSGGLATQGAALERLISSLDASGMLPRGTNAAIVLASGRFISKQALTILGALMLVPALIMTVSWLLVTRLRPEAWVRHLRNMASFVAPVAMTLLVAWLAARLGLIPVYLNQAVISSQAAIQPNWWIALGLVVLGFIFFAVARHFIGYLKPLENRASTEMAKLTSGLALLTVGLLLLLTASPFSLAPTVTMAWIWPLCTCFLEPPSPTVPWWPHPRSNLWLLGLSLIGPLAFYAYLAANTAAGWLGAWWFVLVQVVSGAYGIAGPAGATFLTAGFLLLMGSRRLQLRPVESLRRTDELKMVEPPPPRVLKVRRKTRTSR